MTISNYLYMEKIIKRTYSLKRNPLTLKSYLMMKLKLVKVLVE